MDSYHSTYFSFANSRFSESWGAYYWAALGQRPLSTLRQLKRLAKKTLAAQKRCCLDSKIVMPVVDTAVAQTTRRISVANELVKDDDLHNVLMQAWRITMRKLTCRK